MMARHVVRLGSEAERVRGTAGGGQLAEVQLSGATVSAERLPRPIPKSKTGPTPDGADPVPTYRKNPIR